jgi:hypothetical protein
MTLREFIAAFKGFEAQKRDEYAVQFEGFRFNAMATAFSKAQADAAKKAVNPFIEKVKRENKPVLTMDKVGAILKPLSNGTT